MEGSRQATKVILVAILLQTVCSAYATSEWSIIDRTDFQYGHSLETLPPLEGYTTNNYVREEALPVPDSKWQAWESQQYRKVVASHKVDVLVLPPQVHGIAFTPITRTLFASMLSDVFRPSGKQLFDDPFLLRKAFPDKRVIDHKYAVQLAEDMGAERIVESFIGFRAAPIVGPNAGRPMDVFIGLVDHVLVDGKWVRKVSKPFHRPLQLEGSPFDVFRQMLPEISHFLELELPIAPTVSHAAIEQRNWLPFSPTPEQVTQASKLQQAYYLQMLGSLVPVELSDTRKEFFARSLQLLWQLENVDGRLDGLIARAFIDLELIAAARKVLDSSPTSHCYQHFARLNIVALKECAMGESGPERALLLLDVFSLAVWFGLDRTPHVENVYDSIDPNSGFLPYVGGFVASYDGWGTADARWLKSELDKYYPITGYTVESIDRIIAAGTGSPDTMLLAPIRHFKQILENKAEHAFPVSRQGVSSGDKLKLIFAQSLERVYHRGVKLSKTQALPIRAARFVDYIDAQLLGHPVAAYLRGLAHKAAISTSGDASNFHHEQALEHFLRVAHWEQGASFIATKARHDADGLNRPEWSLRWPSMQEYPDNLWFLRPQVDSGYKHDLSFSPFKVELTRRIERNAPIDDLADFFVGHPERNQILIKRFIKQGEWAQAEKLAKEQTSQFPDLFHGYKDLGEIYMRTAQFEKAAESYANYLPFQTREQDGKAIQHNNNATTVGLAFMSAGRPDLAEPFLQANAEYRTGSGMYFLGLSHLCQLQRNLTCTAMVEQQSMQRYGGVDAIAGFINALAVYGDHVSVDTLFENYAPNNRYMMVWAGALISQRARNWNNRQLIEWLKQDNISAISKPNRAQLNHYVRHVTTDRGHEEIDWEFVRHHAPIWLEAEGRRMTLASYNKATNSELVAKPGDIVKVSLPGLEEPYELLALPDKIEVYLQLHDAIAQGRFDAARQVLGDDVLAYGSTEHSILPTAWVLVENNDASLLEEMLDKARRVNWLMPHELASALLAGYQGNHDEALTHIDRARGFHLGTGDRWAFSPYLIAKALDILWEKTNDSRYREAALEWARSTQILHYGYAWAYSLEAKLSQDSSGRLEATRKALFLDPRSFWLASVPQNIVEQARELNDRSSPFEPMFPSPEQPAAKNGPAAYKPQQQVNRSMVGT